MVKQLVCKLMYSLCIMLQKSAFICNMAPNVVKLSILPSGTKEMICPGMYFSYKLIYQPLKLTLLIFQNFSCGGVSRRVFETLIFPYVSFAVYTCCLICFKKCFKSRFHFLISTIVTFTLGAKHTVIWKLIRLTNAK